jgi:hypothetical protein
LIEIKDTQHDSISGVRKVSTFKLIWKHLKFGIFSSANPSR